MVSKTIHKILSNKSKMLIGFIILVSFVIICILLIQRNTNVVNIDLIQKIYKVEKMDLVSTISGSGPIISSNRTNILSKTNSIVNKVYFSEGDSVKAGDLICEFDTSNASQQVEKYRNDLMQSKLTQQQNTKDQKKLNITAPFNGVIVDIEAEKGDLIQKNGVVFTIANTDKMDFTVSISSTDISKISKGDNVNVNIPNFMQTIKGKITDIGASPYSNELGGEVYNIDITLNNPGALTEGMNVSADFKSAGKGVTSLNMGTLNYTKKLEIRSESGGTVKNVLAKQYQRVKQGDSIINLQEEDIVEAIKIMDLKLKDLESVLQNSKDSLSDYKVYSPMDGVISKLNAVNGVSFKAGDIVAVIVDNKQMEFTIPIDELDIDTIKLGQKAEVSFDAIPSTSVKPVIGAVSKIAVEGEPQNGVTTFQVTVKIGNSQSNYKNAATKNMSTNNAAKKKQRALKKANAKLNKSNVKNQTINNNNNNNAKTTPANNKTNTNNTLVNNQTGINKGILSRLKGGMYANTEIFINNKKGILAVPLEGVFKIGGKSYVMVKSNLTTIEKLKKENKYINVFSDNQKTYTNVNKATQQNNNKNKKQAATKTIAKVTKNNMKQYEEYFSNCIPTVVELGINNEYSVEIKSGLKEGLEVVLPQLTLKQTTKTPNANTNASLGGLSTGNNNNKNK